MRVVSAAPRRARSASVERRAGHAGGGDHRLADIVVNTSDTDTARRDDTRLRCDLRPDDLVDQHRRTGGADLRAGRHPNDASHHANTPADASTNTHADTDAHIHTRDTDPDVNAIRSSTDRIRNTTDHLSTYADSDGSAADPRDRRRVSDAARP
jgi:hypothetical protein